MILLEEYGSKRDGGILKWVKRCCDLLRIEDVIKWHLYAVLIFMLLSFPAKKCLFSFIREVVTVEILKFICYTLILII